MKPEILIVDDSPTQLESLRYCLEQAGYSVTAADNGSKALESLRTSLPALIISDIVMPGMTGFQLCHAVKEYPKTRNIPVVLLTSLDRAEDVLTGLESQADYYVTKPLDEEHLLELLPRILAGAAGPATDDSEVTVELPFTSGVRRVNAVPRRMLTLLVSSYEAAVRNNKALLMAEKELQELNDNLETLVQERTDKLLEEVAERRRIADALIKSEELYRTLVEQASDGIFIAGMDGRFTDVNSAGCALVGYSRETILSKTLMDLVPDGTRTVFQQQMERVRSGRSLVFESRMNRSQGGPVDVEISAKALPDGRIQQIVRDVSARKQTEKQVEALAKFPNENPFPVMRIQSDNRLDFSNEASLTILDAWNCHTGNLVPKPYSDVVTAVLENGKMQTRVFESGDRIWELHFAPIPSMGYVNVYGQDVTESRLAEERIRQSELRYRRLFESAKDGILILMADSGKILDINPYLLSLIGLPREDALGRQLWQLGMLSDAPVSREKFAELQRQDYVRYENLPLKTADGKEVDVEFVSNTYFVGTNKVIQCNIRDISDRVKAEREIRTLNESLESRVAERTLQLEKANRELEAAMVEVNSANKAKGDFLAAMSHEIRTPMNAIIGFSDLALKTTLTPSQRDYLEKIHRSGLSLLGTINDILDLSKIEAGRLTIERIDFSLEEVLDAVASVTAQRAYAKGLEFILNVPPDIPRDLQGDPSRLQQVLVNLVGNAVKFTEKGEIEVSIQLLSSLPRIELRFSVRDSGIGLSKEQLGKMFQPFSQADSSMSRKYGGTGLGLNISRRLVEMMDGKVHVESEPGRGSTFSFTAQFDPGSRTQHVRDRLPATLAGMRILVVDDNFLVRETVRKMLISQNFKVDAAGTGEKAVQMILESDKKEPFRLVLMDWLMPGIDGIEAMGRIRKPETVHNIPEFIILSAWGEGEDEKTAALRAGASAFLRKPVTPSSLLDTILTLVCPSPITGAETECPEPDADQELEGARVLLVEDNEMNQQIAMELLRNAGMTVDVADNGYAALEKLEDPGTGYDMILLDIQMPGMDGFETLRRIREQERFRKIPVIAMTAHALLEDRRKARSAGMDGYITKPLDPANMFRVLRRFYTGKPSPKKKRERAAAEAGDRTIPRIEGIDSEAGLARVVGNISLYADLLRRFADGQSDAPDRIRSALAAGDLPSAEHIAHTLKGVAGNIGAQTIQSAAGELEAAFAGQSKEPEIEARLDGLSALIREAAGRIRSALPAERKIPEVRGANQVSTADIAKLKKLIEENDGEAVDHFESIREKAAASWAEGDFTTMEKALREFNFQDALQVLVDIIQRA